jgi:hypothetical protein
MSESRNYYKMGVGRRRARRSVLGGVLRFLSVIFGLALFGAFVLMSGNGAGINRGLAGFEKPKAGSVSAYYANCAEARRAGVAPIHSWQPGYRSELDGDSDGIACEPYYGSSW